MNELYEEQKRIWQDADDIMIDLTPAMTPEEIESALTGTATTWTPSTMGRKGGSRKSPAKTRACSRNGKKGGWPKGKPRGKR